MRTYDEDLAYVHDVGFGDFARSVAPGVLEILRRAGVTDGQPLHRRTPPSSSESHPRLGVRLGRPRTG